MIKAVLFDFDGTLADTLPLCFGAFRDVFARYENKTLSNVEIVRLFGPTEEDIVRRFVTDKRVAEEAVTRFYSLYADGHRGSIIAHPGVAELLRKLRQLDIPLGIVTGKGRRSLDISLRELGMADYFAVTISGDDVERPKPDPEGVRKALRSIGCEPEHALFVGDSDADIGAGRGAGTATVGVKWFETVQTDVFAVEPHLTVTSPDALYRYVEANRT